MKTSEVSNVIPRADLETFVHLGEQISHYESVDTRYPIKMPKSIEQQARTLDEKLAEITVCDPAVGSGAFPVGMMTEIVRARSALTPYFNDIHERTPYHFKRHAIQNCLYGVDIDPGAVEIAKLRLWLSLVVDEEDVKRIKPLPNLDYKIVAGNSLLGFPFKSQRVGEIEELKQRFFDETDHAKKAQLKTQVDKLLAECFAASKKSLGYAVDFDFEIFFSEVFQRKGGFDVVIANPPYVRQEQIKELKPLLQKQYKCYTGTADLYVYFYERGFKLLQAGGVLTYISSNKYFRSAYGEKLRRFLGSNAAVQQLIDFGDAPVFEAIAYPSIIVARKVQPDANEVRAFTWKAGPPIEDFAAIFQAKSFFITQSKLTADGWRLESSAVLRLLDKLRNAGQPLGEYVDGQIYSGIKTGLNEAFVVDRATRDRLIGEDKSSEEILKPFLRGRDVKRWQVQYGEQYLIKIESSENKAHPWSGKADKPAEKVFAETYPAIYRHLNQFRQALIQRGDKGHYFWELRSCTYWHRFERPKIIYPNICKRNEFAWDNENYLSNQKSFFIPDASKYLLGVLNSSTTMWLFSRLLAKLQNEFYEPSAIFMEKVPIPVTDKPKHIETLADKILAAKQRDPKADTTALEREIDRLVYQLYGLTPEEIAIVEESTRAK